MEHNSVFSLSIKLEWRIVWSFTMTRLRSHRDSTLDLICLSSTSNQMLYRSIRLFVTSNNSSIFNCSISSWIISASLTPQQHVNLGLCWSVFTLLLNDWLVFGNSTVIDCFQGFARRWSWRWLHQFDNWTTFLPFSTFKTNLFSRWLSIFQFWESTR